MNTVIQLIQNTSPPSLNRKNCMLMATICSCSPEHIETIFNHVCASGNIRIVRWMYNKFKIQINISLGFYQACKHGHMRLIRWMYCNNPDIQIHIELLLFKWGNIHVVKFFYEEFKIYTDIPHEAFGVACSAQNTELVAWILENDANHPPSRTNLTRLLHCAIYTATMKTVKWIISTFPTFVPLQIPTNIMMNNTSKGFDVLEYMLSRPHMELLYSHKILLFACVHAPVRHIAWLLNYFIIPSMQFPAQIISRLFDSASSNKKPIQVLSLLHKTYSEIFDVHQLNNKLMHNACSLNQIHSAKWYYSLNTYIPNQKFEIKIFNQACEDGNVHICSWMYNICKPNDVSIAFTRACMSDYGYDGATWISKHIFKQSPPNPKTIIKCLLCSCSFGNIETCRFIHRQYSQIINDNMNDISLDDISASFINCIDTDTGNYFTKWFCEIFAHRLITNNEFGPLDNLLYVTAMSDNTELLNWLFDLYTPQTEKISKCFTQVCNSDIKLAAKWFADYKPDVYSVTFENIRTHTVVSDPSICDFTDDIIIKHWHIIMPPLTFEICLPPNEIDTCPICYENTCNILSNCSHIFCEPCVQKLHVSLCDKICPMCRHTPTTYKMFKCT